MATTTRISWEDEKAFLGFHPAALADDVGNVLLDCAFRRPIFDFRENALAC